MGRSVVVVVGSVGSIDRSNDGNIGSASNIESPRNNGSARNIGSAGKIEKVAASDKHHQ